MERIRVSLNVQINVDNIAVQRIATAMVTLREPPIHARLHDTVIHLSTK